MGWLKGLGCCHSCEPSGWNSWLLDWPGTFKVVLIREWTKRWRNLYDPILLEKNMYIQLLVSPYMDTHTYIFYLSIYLYRRIWETKTKNGKMWSSGMKGCTVWVCMSVLSDWSLWTWINFSTHLSMAHSLTPTWSMLVRDDCVLISASSS